jgi:hypothetical protein
MIGLGGIGEAKKMYRVVFRVLRYGSYEEETFVEANSANEAKKLGEKKIRNFFAPRTKMEFVKVEEIK